MMQNNLVLKRLSDSIAELDNKLFPCLINGLLPDPAFVMVHAIAKTGKTRFVTQLCLALARGSSFMNRKVEYSKKICYIDQELGATNFSFRIRDAGIDLVGTEENFWIADGNLSLSDESGFDYLKDLIVKYSIGVIVIDSLSQVHSMNENRSEEMLPLMNKLKAIKNVTGCSIILIHHQGKKNENSGSGPQSFRGSSVLLDVVDVSFGIFRGPGEKLRVEVTNRYFPATTLMLEDTGSEFKLAEEQSPVEKSSKDTGDAVLALLKGSNKTVRSRIEICKAISGQLGVSNKTVERAISRLAELGRLALYQTGKSYIVELIPDNQTTP